MAFFTFFFFSLGLTIFYASVAYAAPWPVHVKHSTFRTRIIGRGLKVETYYPKSVFWTASSPMTKDSPQVDQSSSFIEGNLNASAIAFFQSQLGIDADRIMYNSGYNATAGKYAYVKQQHNGIPFANAVGNVAWYDGKVISYGSSFVDPTHIAPSEPSRDINSSISVAEEALEGKYNDHPPTLEYLANSDGSIDLAHVIQVQNEGAGTWFEAYVSAHSGKLLSVTDFVAHASYTVVPFTKNAFPDGVETLKDPQDILASPFGWHSDNINSTTTTVGNNVIAVGEKQPTVQSSDGLTFDYRYDDTLNPTVPTNLDAARTNAFYILNTMHDIAYRYGFTESSFNFQAKNFDKGGRGDDVVQVIVQDPSNLNNANFASPPDGQPGICRMFVWDKTEPRRDGAMENDILIHEMTHGITNRMTGGGTGRCLQSVEAGGLGEGWSDAMADWVSQRSFDTVDFVAGKYVFNDARGLRQFPYSTDPVVNPLRYSSVKSLSEVHNIGEVWANMLHNVYAALVKRGGFVSTASTNPDGTAGNVVFMHLFIDSLSLQPCTPTFVSARDAWIQADKNRYNGAHKCILFAAFASRGLGLNAPGDFVDNEDVPFDCAATAGS